MSKAFGIVNRKKHFEHLEQILEPDKPHVLNIITSFTQFKVKIIDSIGKTFRTIIGIIPLGPFKCNNLYFALGRTLARRDKNIHKSILMTLKYAYDIT